MIAGTRVSNRRHVQASSLEDHLRVMADVFGLLADRSRLRILMYLREYEEACVSDLARVAGLSESAVSHALRLLRAHGVVDTRRDGHWMYYSLVDEHVCVLLDATVEHLERDHAERS